MNQAIVRVDGVTQQNAAVVEEATAAAESLQQPSKPAMAPAPRKADNEWEEF